MADRTSACLRAAGGLRLVVYSWRPGREREGLLSGPFGSGAFAQIRASSCNRRHVPGRHAAVAQRSPGGAECHGAEIGSISQASKVSPSHPRAADTHASSGPPTTSRVARETETELAVEATKCAR
jgi:hypothetical protein